MTPERLTPEREARIRRWLALEKMLGDIGFDNLAEDAVALLREVDALRAERDAARGALRALQEES